MASLLPGDPTVHGMVEGGPCSFSQEKPEEVGCWYLSRKEIEENSPSRRDGIDLKKETYLRKSYCTFLQDLGMRLKVPQVTIATAIIFCHRFFLRQSLAKNERRTIATVCMFLAGKVEETPRPLKDVILVSYEIINKKDPSAVQRIKQKEVYEQQKELILLGERTVLATLGFDFNVLHPYKPLVEAIKKFKVSQNALAQVAWNFVNDGLRTSLCLQFKPHHIAAGAIFLAAKFLKVKLPSDGEKVWWQEFDVTPRQLEVVSNQMLELYEQNRLPSSQGSEVEGSAGGGSGHWASAKTSAANEETVSPNSFAQGASTVIPGTSMPSTRSVTGPSYADNLDERKRSNQSQSNDYGSVDARSVISDQKENAGETSDTSRFGPERHVEEDQYSNNGRREDAEAGERKNKGAQYKIGCTGGRSREGFLVQSPKDAIKQIDKDKVKAALEKRRKSRGDVSRKMDLMDEDDLIERELEDGVELAAEDDKINRERKQSQPKFPSEPENPKYGKDQYIGDGNNLGAEGHSSWEPDVEHVEEGELSFDVAGQGFHSPKLSNRKRKAVSPDKHKLEGKLRHDSRPGYHHNNHDILDNGSKMGRLGYGGMDYKRHVQENHV